jgi:hypothetical protein
VGKSEHRWVRVSEYYNLGRSQGQLDFVDVDVRGDSRLYIDPRALRLLPTLWGQECVSLVQDFFTSVLEAIRAGRGDYAQRLLLGLREPNETHLGLSTDVARGSALGPRLARDTYEALAASEAVERGLLADLEETALMVPGVDKDRVSDITTNIIREPLIYYTQAVCEQYGIPLEVGVNSGPLWSPGQQEWFSRFERLPMTSAGKLLLVPKLIVRRQLHYNRSEYLNHYLLEHLQHVELSANSELVQLLKDGRRRVTKKDLRRKYGTTKPAIVELTLRYPEVLERYRTDKAAQPPDALSHLELSEHVGSPPPDLGELLVAVSGKTPGREQATDYHKAVEAFLSALFYPHLASPQIEREIHEGRKRVDLAYANTAKRGFFAWIGNHYPSQYVFVECKNYTEDPENPELDQLAGRFSPRRGQVGLLVARAINDKELMLRRCRDTADDGRGFIIPLDDHDLGDLVDQPHGHWGEFPLLRERFDQLVL